MSKHDILRDSTSEITEKLLSDIANGKGNELIPVPVSDDPEDAEYIEEIKQFWRGKEIVSRYDLFTTILKYCATDKEDFKEIAQTIANHYPEVAECELTSSSITGIVHRFRNGGSENSKEQTNNEKVSENGSEQSGNVGAAFVAATYEKEESLDLDLDFDETDGAFEPIHKPNLNKPKVSAANSKKMQEYKEATAARLAMAQEREAVNRK